MGVRTIRSRELPDTFICNDRQSSRHQSREDCKSGTAPGASRSIRNSQNHSPSKRLRFHRAGQFIVTPDMHRVHHSVGIAEANRNFGFNLAWWDWIFATCLAQPNEPHQSITLGLPDSGPTERPETLVGMLAMPFRPVQRSCRPK
jgi:hypothetical protein